MSSIKDISHESTVFFFFYEKMLCLDIFNKSTILLFKVERWKLLKIQINSFIQRKLCKSWVTNSIFPLGYVLFKTSRFFSQWCTPKWRFIFSVFYYINFCAPFKRGNLATKSIDKTWMCAAVLCSSCNDWLLF